MADAGSGQPAPPRTPDAIKILVAGGLGAGKTTMVAALSEGDPGQADELVSVSQAVPAVAVDFGRITLRDDLVVYLFGAPGQQRLSVLLDEIAPGALGAVVVADTRRLTDCFALIDYLERHQTPFVVAVNCFDGAVTHQPQEVRAALSLAAGVPVLLCDARSRASGRDVLVRLVEHVHEITGVDPAASGAR